MLSHKHTLGLLLTALLASTSPVALAGPLDGQPFGLENDEETLSLDLDPAWQLFGPTSKPSIFNLGAPAFASPAPSTTAASTFPADENQSVLARAIRYGYPVGFDPATLPAELKRGHAFSENFTAGIKAGFDAPVGEEMRLTTAVAQTRYTLGHIGPAISWGWHTDIGVLPENTGPNAVASGPQFRFGDERMALTFSPKVAHTFGAHNEGDVAFAYAAGLKGELAKGVALGIEAFGATSHNGSTPGAAALQAYRTHPGLYIGLGLLPQQKADPGRSNLSLEIGALADMTEANPDWTGQLKAAVTW